MWLGVPHTFRDLIIKILDGYSERLVVDGKTDNSLITEILEKKEWLWDMGIHAQNSQYCYWEGDYPNRKNITWIDYVTLEWRGGKGTIMVSNSKGEWKTMKCLQETELKKYLN